MSLRFLIVAFRTTAILIACAALVPVASAGGLTRTITTINAASKAGTGDPNNAPKSVGEAAMSGAKRGAIAGGIAGGLAGFFGLARMFNSKRDREEPSNRDREGRPYF
jgi:hypothetical protein